MIRYLTHPQVDIDPAKDIPCWSLSAEGSARVQALARSGALTGTTTVISSDETKALETATPLAEALGCTLHLKPQMHENDRSATGYLPAAEFERTADAFFGQPTISVRGWETASAAQARIVTAYRECRAQHRAGDILFVGHGAVGTLLYCHLNGLPISRTHDQLPGGGCYLDLSQTAPSPPLGWQPLEALFTQT